MSVTTFDTKQRAQSRTQAIITQLCAAAMLTASVAVAHGQTYGFATLPPGTLNYTTASAVAKVLKEKAGISVLVQPTAGDNIILPIVGRNEAMMGIANAVEIGEAIRSGKLPDLRLIGAAHPLRSAFFVRKDSPMKTVSDVKGRKVALGYSAMQTIDLLSRAILAAGGLTERDVIPVLVPNVVRGAENFTSGAADMFFFAFGAPKVREVDATVGGIRALEIKDSGMEAARKVSTYGYLSDVAPGPVYVGVFEPMKVYTFDNVLVTNAKVSDELIFNIIDTLDRNKAALADVQPVLREFSAAGLYKKYDIPYHPGALKYFKEHNINPQALM